MSPVTGDVFGMLAWVDPVGRWWVAPLGSPAPDVDRAMPPEWIPIVRIERRHRRDWNDHR